MELNWDAIGAIGEVFGGVTVLATLFYFSFQIRQSNKLAEAQSQRELLNLNVFNPIIENPNLTTEYRACLNRYEKQDADVKTRFNFIMLNYCLQIEAVFRMHEQGLIAEQSYNGFLSACSSMINTPGGSSWWSEVSGTFALDFIEALATFEHDPNSSYPNTSLFDVFPFLKEVSTDSWLAKTEAHTDL